MAVSLCAGRVVTVGSPLAVLCLPAGAQAPAAPVADVERADYLIGPGDVLTGRTTVLQGLALAGGFKEFAKTDSIVIIRGEKGAETAVAFNDKRLEASRELAQNVALRPGDTVLVP
jgi:protein involved in polysaccharide export with SLBB domain